MPTLTSIAHWEPYPQQPLTRIRLNENNPAWLTKPARDIPTASWRKTTISNDPLLNARHPDIKTGLKDFEKLPSDRQHAPKNIIQNQQPLSPLTASSPNLVQKDQNWKEWAYIGGSCHIHHGRQVIGAGIYHPDTGCQVGFRSNLIHGNEKMGLQVLLPRHGHF
eukprot:778075-Pelagomonas_calceolata.AAC.2